MTRVRLLRVAVSVQRLGHEPNVWRVVLVRWSGGVVAARAAYSQVGARRWPGGLPATYAHAPAAYGTLQSSEYTILQPTNNPRASRHSAQAIAYKVQWNKRIEYRQGTEHDVPSRPEPGRTDSDLQLCLAARMLYGGQ